MAGKLFGMVSLVSVILLSCTFLLWLVAFLPAAGDYSLSVTNDFHIGIWSDFLGTPSGDIVFFNDKESGPYRGSIISLTGEKGNPDNPYIKKGWGPGFGVYYRHILWPESGSTLWTLAISFAYPLAFFSILPLIWLWRRRRKCRKSKE